MQKSLLEMSADIVAAQARQNSMGMDEMAESLRKVFYTLQEIQQSADGTSSEDTGSSDSLDHLRRNPTESIQRNQIICLESGKPYKLLSNRHLALYGMTPREYKKKWGIPLTMPLSARSLTKRRRKLAKELGMGKQLAAWRAQRKQLAG
ncbi:MAG: MucR family transcriptional regulator [Candidatus Tectomicrobia bacterium]